MIAKSSPAAVISRCQAFRYRLDRHWDDLRPPLVAGLLNPSTADANKDDPTIARLLARAQAMQMGSLIVWNAFAYRATDPAELLSKADPIGPENDRYIFDILTECRHRKGLALIGWGAHKMVHGRIGPIMRIAEAVGIEFYCVGTNRDGSPKHPLYVPYSAAPAPWKANC